MSEQTLLKRNLLALSPFDPQLSTLAGNALPSPRIEYRQARTHQLVPCLRSSDALVPLHSCYDPGREGEKLFQVTKADGYLVFLGLGGGYHILPFLACASVSHILIIDRDLEIFRSILENIDLRSLIIDHRVKFLIDRTPEEIKEFILASYIPSLYGDLVSVPLYTRLNTEFAYFDEVVKGIRDILGKVADDYTVQSHFGKRWFCNTIMNLEAAERSTLLLKPSRKVLVTGAGPSLETQIETVKQMKNDGFLIATDTSLPALLSHDIVPDCVISIDCQHIGYHHFLRGLPPEVPLVLDLASPPILTRLTDKVIFFSSGHPFSQYVTNYWRMFPAIDTSGGNVSHAALSLAGSLGAGQIYLFGIDFSFPEGKSYARDTYQYHYFRTYEDRLHPLDTLFFSSIFRNKRVIKERVPGFIRYTTKPMISYKERMELAIANLAAEVIQAPGRGLPLMIAKSSRQEALDCTRLFAQGPAFTGWREFLTGYRDKLMNLKEPYYPVIKYLNDLTHFERDLWTTQYPALASFREFYLENASPAPPLLKITRDWAIGRIGAILGSHGSKAAHS